MPSPTLRGTALALLATLALAVPAAGQDGPAGTFTGANNHVTTGGVSLVEGEGGHQVVLGEDFSLDGAPDPVVAVSNGESDAPTIVSKLESNEGAQSYAVPEDVDASEVTRVYIWCEEYSVSLGHADLSN